ncbi:8c131974-e9c7-419f-966b-99c870b2d75e [Sclerotinia trifoliorum]|uniref:8c131974-e9c7-419f-966b-99c870b2d75e n=1 Tax=Sclerotinia trifoliorum TaxID=28548 RepID=A0A8H2ZLI7_9HELO|nr:8c131974-e9c7-419f-966b-99c870b2d75e [Sclerotinia trifoliorum]
MDMTSSYQNGVESSNLDQSHNYVPNLTFSPAHNSVHYGKGQPFADSQVDFITSLKVRIAVLENDLVHTTKDKDEAVKSSVIIARALGNVANNSGLIAKKLPDPDTGELAELRLEVKRLKTENGVLLGRLGDVSLTVPGGYPTLSTPRKRNIKNFKTLDDVLSSDEEEEEQEVKIEDQILYQERADANFINIPTPAVLKCGFEFSPEKAVRGDNYANRGYTNRDNYYARFNNRNVPTGPRSFEFPPDMSEGTSIWATPQQRDGEINTHMRASDSREHRFPDYFRYGVVYVPKADDRDTLRGVHIGGLPKDIGLRDVLARVRGGRIYSSVLLDTMNVSGSNSALITFMNQANAEAYVEYANAHPITFGTSDSAEENQTKAIITHLHTPTFPFSPAKLKAIFEFNRTRILTIRNFPQHISLRGLESDLAGRNALKANSLLEWYIDEEGLSEWNLGYKDFRLVLQFERDSCEGDLEELEKEPEKRKPMFPRTKFGVRGERCVNGGVNGLGNSGSVETFGCRTDEVTTLDNSRKDQDTAFITPKRGPRIIAGKQWLLEIASAKTSTSQSTLTIPNASAHTPDTPTSNNSTPRPRLTISTTSLPPPNTNKSRSPDPSSAEYSIHSFASSAVSVDDEDDLPGSFPPKNKDQAQAPAPVQIKTTKNFLASFGGPLVYAGKSTQSSQKIQALHSDASNLPTQTLKTFRNNLVVRNADTDTNVYFVPGADNEKAILDSEVDSQRGSDDREKNESLEKFSRDVCGDFCGEDMGKSDEGGSEEKRDMEGSGKTLGKEMKMEMKNKINPDEIDLGLQSDGDVTDADGHGEKNENENEGLFQKELIGKSTDHSETSQP